MTFGERSEESLGSSASSSGLQSATLCRGFNQSLGDTTLPRGLRSWMQLSIALSLLEGKLPKDVTVLLRSGTSDRDHATAGGKLSEVSRNPRLLEEHDVRRAAPAGPARGKLQGVR